MADWSFVQWVKLGAIALACFAVVGGIVSQTTEGASGRGLLEGMWKGVEWFLIALVACAALYGAWFGFVWLAGTLNT